MNSFTECLAKLIRCGERQEQLVQDLNIFDAPSECFGPALRGERNRVKNIIAEHGFTPLTLQYEIAIRGLSGWVVRQGIPIPSDENCFVAQVLGRSRLLDVYSSRTHLVTAGRTYEPPRLPHKGGRDYDTLFVPGEWVMGRAYGFDRVLLEAPKKLPEMWWTR